MTDPVVPPSRLRICQIRPHRAQLAYIQLTSFPTHYLALVVTGANVPYARISVKIVPGGCIKASSWRTLDDSTWRRYVDAAGRRERRRQHGSQGLEVFEVSVRNRTHIRCWLTISRFKLKTLVLRELYTYCW
jgi:hypothetical protein